MAWRSVTIVSLSPTIGGIARIRELAKPWRHSTGNRAITEVKWQIVLCSAARLVGRRIFIQSTALIYLRCGKKIRCS